MKPLAYSHSALIRDPEERKGFDRLGQAAWRHARARWHLYWQDRTLFAAGQALSFDQFDQPPTVFLGRQASTKIFAADLSDWDEAQARAFAETRGAEWADLRRHHSTLAADLAAILAYGRGMVYWHRRTRFCGVCGSPTFSAEAGHLRQCANSACAALHYPRTDPAVIMLVVNENGIEPRVLLGRQASWPEGVMSALAGFVEPGESLEEAVRREVREEVGILIGDVAYRGSQPWPFPSSLMLGFRAEALSHAIAIDPNELEKARWFSLAELRAPGVVQKIAPRPDSIARFLIEEWIAEA